MTSFASGTHVSMVGHTASRNHLIDSEFTGLNSAPVKVTTGCFGDRAVASGMCTNGSITSMGVDTPRFSSRVTSLWLNVRTWSSRLISRASMRAALLVRMVEPSLLRMPFANRASRRVFWLITSITMPVIGVRSDQRRTSDTRGSRWCRWISTMSAAATADGKTIRSSEPRKHRQPRRHSSVRVVVAAIKEGPLSSDGNECDLNVRGSSLGADKFSGVAGTRSSMSASVLSRREPCQGELATRVRNPSVRHVRAEAGDAHQLDVTTPTRPWRGSAAVGVRARIAERRSATTRA